MQEEMCMRTREAPLCSCADHIPCRHRQVGSRKVAICLWGVLSNIVLGGWESQPHASEPHKRFLGHVEGSDGSTQPTKETRAGHVGLDKHEQTSLRGIATGSWNG